MFNFKCWQRLSILIEKHFYSNYSYVCTYLLQFGIVDQKDRVSAVSLILKDRSFDITITSLTMFLTFIANGAFATFSDTICTLYINLLKWEVLFKSIDMFCCYYCCTFHLIYHFFDQHNFSSVRQYFAIKSIFAQKPNSKFSQNSIILTKELTIDLIIYAH